MGYLVKALRRFRDAGADEIATYGSTPGQNERLVEAWRSAAPADPASADPASADPAPSDPAPSGALRR